MAIIPEPVGPPSLLPNLGGGVVEGLRGRVVGRSLTYFCLYADRAGGTVGAQ